MAPEEPDTTDRGILFLLQQNARDVTSTEIAEEVGVSAGTVRNRIERLEDRDIIEGYLPQIDYENAGFKLQVLFTCAGPKRPSDDFAREILDQHGVISVRKLLAGDENIHVEAIGTSTEDVSKIAQALPEHDLEIVRSEVVEDHYYQPFNHFGQEIAADG